MYPDNFNRPTRNQPVWVSQDKGLSNQYYEQILPGSRAEHQEIMDLKGMVPTRSFNVDFMAWDIEMIGRTAIFTNIKHARRLLKNLNNKKNEEGKDFEFVVVEARIEKDLLNAKFKMGWNDDPIQANVFVGKRLTILKESVVAKQVPEESLEVSRFKDKKSSPRYNFFKEFLKKKPKK